jgi:hypothetical protein
MTSFNLSSGHAPPNSIRKAIALLSMLVCLLGGCSKTASYERYIPSDEVSQAAITTMLQAWKQGVPAGPVPETKPVVHVTDQHRRRNEKLVDYRILGEVPGDTPRCYAVQLQFEPQRDEHVRFIVVGIDPLWVFRFEDYLLLAHWEHKMDDPPSNKQPAAP